jgi:hydrogenase-4 component E
MEGVIRTLSLTLILTSFVVVEVRSLRRALLAYMVQALVMVAIIACFASYHPALWVWAATALLTKFALVSWMLARALGTDDRECPPLVGPLASGLFVAVLAATAYSLLHHSASFLAPTPLAQQEPFRTNIAVSLTLLFVGLYAITTRRDAIKVVLGVCLMENGAHLSLVSLAATLRETVLIGVTTDVVVAVFLLLTLVRGIERRLGSRDTSRLVTLRG